MRNLEKQAVFTGILVLFLLIWTVTGYGAEKTEWQGQELVEEDYEELDRFLKENQPDTGVSISFSDLVQTLIEGNGKQAGEMIVTAVRDALFTEIAHGGKMAGQLLALGMIGAIFAGFSDIFSGGQISDTGFFLTYLMAFAVIAGTFADSAALVGALLERQIQFMKVLMPSYFLAAAWAGAGASSAAWYEVVLFLISMVQLLYRKLLIPLVRVFILLSMAGNMAREDMFSGMTGLLKSGIGWGIRSLFGVVIGFQLIQGMVLPYADAVKTSGVQKLLQVIPGVGQGTEAVMKMVLGSGALIKNGIGASAVVILLLFSLIPLVKLLVLLVLYRMAAAVIQPVGDKRLVSCISSAAEGQKLLVQMAFSSLTLFLITIALVCAGTNVVNLI